MSTGSNGYPWWTGNYQGSRWVRVDFHLHTPGVNSFRCPNGLDPRNEAHKSQIVRDYVRQLHDQGIKLAAITDYNGIRKSWFMPIRDEAAKLGIVVLPGTELDFGPGSAGKRGLHVLAIFDAKTDPDAINRVINSVDRNVADPLFGDDGSHREIEPADGVEKAIKEIRRQLSPIIILPHPNDDKGLFKSYSLQGQAKFICDIEPHAIECFEDTDRQRLLSTGAISKDVLNRVASVDFSDPKSIGDIGTKFRQSGCLRTTYLKISTLEDIRAVALAMADSQVMVRVGTAPQLLYTRLLAVEVEGSGFLGGMRVVWSPELNTIIGGRGAGKSALLETIRYALDIKPFVETEYRASLVKHSLESGGKVSVWLERHVGGSVYRIYRVDRVYGQKPRVYEISADYRSETQVDLAPGDILGYDVWPLFFGQREIYSIAVDPVKRVNLIDDVIGSTAREKQIEIRKREEELRKNGAEIARLRRILEQKEDKQKELDGIRHEIQLYQREGLADKLRDMTLLSKDEEILRLIVSRAGTIGNILDSAETEIEESSRDIARLSLQAQSSNRGIVQSASRLVDSLVSELKAMFSEAKSKLATTQSRLAELEKAWKDARMPIDETIRKVKQSLGHDTLDPDRLDRLTREEAKVSAELDVLAKAERELAEAVRRRKEMLEELRDARYNIFSLRRKQADLLTERLRPQVKVSVKYKGNAEEYTKRLAGLFSGSRVDKASLEKLYSAKDMSPADGQHVAEAVRKGPEELARQFDLSPTRSQQIVNWLMQDESRLHELEMLFPDDEIKISMMIDGAEIPVEKLSDGQRATAILLILLQQEDRPLVIDQPEDDLDNRFIYEGVVKILREQKGKRQIIAATHNPNIPVLGDAELIVALTARDGRSNISDIGSIDRRSVREAVKQIMEGGEDAFRLRARKYGAVDVER
ncbi:MAG: AAA family ATPase [Candidatus Fermentithermobacillus carboniphilus]|uniref:AAA family ATPase n=1 Tax=Candidatus Fermentithermobacillus carboniphilus TaxID=3085328 RepID=A0AAT9LF58_9FIRM|nr:MAG: AAA family ATPase [Candidatus Fermentithermobacillus carboniphilus]